MARTPPPRRPNRDGGIQWAKAIVLIVALVIIGIVVLHASGKSTSTTTSSGGGSHSTTTVVTSTTSLGSTTSTTVLPPSQVKVLVLNGAASTRPLAGQWTATVKGKGYTTEPADNASSQVSASAIYIVTPGYLPEAQALATAIGDPSITINQTVTPSAPITPSQQATANLILIIGPDLANSGGSSSSGASSGSSSSGSSHGSTTTTTASST